MVRAPQRQGQFELGWLAVGKAMSETDKLDRDDGAGTPGSAVGEGRVGVAGRAMTRGERVLDGEVVQVGVMDSCIYGMHSL